MATTSQIVLPLSKGESWDSTSRNRPISSEAENRHRSFGEEDGREGVLGEGDFSALEMTMKERGPRRS